MKKLGKKKIIFFVIAILFVIGLIGTILDPDEEENSSVENSEIVSSDVVSIEEENSKEDIIVEESIQEDLDLILSRSERETLEYIIDVSDSELDIKKYETDDEDIFNTHYLIPVEDIDDIKEEIGIIFDSYLFGLSYAYKNDTIVLSYYDDNKLINCIMENGEDVDIDFISENYGPRLIDTGVILQKLDKAEDPHASIAFYDKGGYIKSYRLN